MRIKALWIDDLFLSQIDFIAQAEQYDIDITAYESHEEGMHELFKDLYKYDAVILDAKVKTMMNDDITGLEGLKASRDKLIALNNEIYLPFFIFTAQPDYISSEMFFQSFGKYYIKSKDNERLFSDIKEQVLNKLEYIIRKEYCQALSAFNDGYLDKNGKVILITILKNIKNSESGFTSSEYFGQIRIILESIFRACNKLGLLHDKCIENDKVNLTESCLFLSGFDTKYINVKCSKTHLDKILSESVKSILFITGAANHTVEDRSSKKINLSQYKDYVDSPFLLYSLTFQLLDILIWYKNYTNVYNNYDINKSFWVDLTDLKNRTLDNNFEWVEGKLLSETSNGWIEFKPGSGGKSVNIPPHLVSKHNLKVGDIIKVTLQFDELKKRTLVINILK